MERRDNYITMWMWQHLQFVAWDDLPPKADIRMENCKCNFFCCVLF